MTNDELELAIEYVDVMIQHPAHNKLSETTIRHLAFLISLAKEYLKIEGFPICKFAAMKEKNKKGGLICQKNTTE